MVCKFRVGEKVRRIAGGKNGAHTEGTVDTVTKLGLHLRGYDGGFYAQNNAKCWCDQDYYELVNEE